MNAPRLFRRNDVPDRQWVAFAYDLAGQPRQIGFITYDALLIVAYERAAPERMFDLNCDRILARAAEKTGAGEVDRRGQVLINVDDALCLGRSDGRLHPE